MKFSIMGWEYSVLSKDARISMTFFITALGNSAISMALSRNVIGVATEKALLDYQGVLAYGVPC